MPGKTISFVSWGLALSLILPALAGPYPQAYRSSVQTRVVDDYLEQRAENERVARLSRRDALKAARRAVPQGKVKEIELENHRGSVVYEVEIVVGEVEFEVIVDAGNGELLWIDSEPEDAD